MISLWKLNFVVKKIFIPNIYNIKLAHFITPIQTMKIQQILFSSQYEKTRALQ